jgi:ATP-dependent Lon protease
MSVTRTRAKELKIANDFQEKLDIHIHVPDGATQLRTPASRV